MKPKPDAAKRAMKRLRGWFRKVAAFCANPRVLLCFGIAWMITNGWAYVFVAVGTYLQINWMAAAGAGYLAIIWMPFTPEKAVTAALALILLRVLFPKDKKTRANLQRVYRNRRHQIKRRNRIESA